MYNAAFVISIYANMKALEGSNVDTVIVFRSCAPLAVAFLEWMFMQRAFPSVKSLFALLLILLGASGYVYTDSAFKLSGWAAYTWCSLWILLLCFLMVFGKVIVDHVSMQSMFGHVYYTNCLSVPPMLLMGVGLNEASAWPHVRFTPGGAVFLFLSSVVGIGLSYTGWQCRDLLSATAYTVVGLMCKLLPVAVNALIWDKHTSRLGSMFLIVCLVGGGLYQQAPLVERKPQLC